MSKENVNLSLSLNIRKFMKAALILLLLSVSFINACERQSLSPSEKSESSSLPKVIVEKEKRERVTPLPSEVKIRLRRDAKDGYSWELNGSDVDQILKVNEKLKKQLGTDQAR